MPCLTLTTPTVIKEREERDEKAETFAEDREWAEAEKVATKHFTTYAKQFAYINLDLSFWIS